MNYSHDLTSSSDDDEFEKKVENIHPLKPTWKFWVWKPTAGVEIKISNWSEFLHEQVKITTIEQFYALYYRLIPPSQQSSSNLSLFLNLLMLKIFTPN